MPRSANGFLVKRFVMHLVAMALVQSRRALDRLEETTAQLKSKLNKHAGH